MPWLAASPLDWLLFIARIDQKLFMHCSSLYGYALLPHQNLFPLMLQVCAGPLPFSLRLRHCCTSSGTLSPFSARVDETDATQEMPAPTINTHYSVDSDRLDRPILLCSPSLSATALAPFQRRPPP